MVARSARVDHRVRARARPRNGESAAVRRGPAAGRHHADLQRRAVPAALEHLRLLAVQQVVRRRRPDARRPVHPRGGPRRRQHAARRRRALRPAAAAHQTVLQHDRLSARLERHTLVQGSTVFLVVGSVEYLMSSWPIFGLAELTWMAVLLVHRPPLRRY